MTGTSGTAETAETSGHTSELESARAWEAAADARRTDLESEPDALAGQARLAPRMRAMRGGRMVRELPSAHESRMDARMANRKDPPAAIGRALRDIAAASTVRLDIPGNRPGLGGRPAAGMDSARFAAAATELEAPAGIEPEQTDSGWTAPIGQMRTGCGREPGCGPHPEPARTTGWEPVAKSAR